MTSFCTGYHGVGCYFIYELYDKLLPAAAVATKLRAGVSKALVDNIIHLPFVYTPVFYLYVGLAQSDGLEKTLATLRREWWDTTVMCCAFWFPFDIMMFSVVPARWRIVVLSVGCLAWNAYLSSCSQAGSKAEVSAPAAAPAAAAVPKPALEVALPESAQQLAALAVEGAARG